jgi:hypothetical protein
LQSLGGDQVSQCQTNSVISRGSKKSVA